MKFAFIYAPYKEHRRSPETGCTRMASLFPSSIFMSDDEVNYEELRSQGYKIFCYGHNPFLYTHRKFKDSCLHDYVNAREEYLFGTIGIKTQSGFSYIKKRLDKYDCYFPTVTTFLVENKSSNVCVGYYARSVRRDTNEAFIKFANTIPNEIPIIVMGEKIPLLRSYEYTTDENTFFSKCSHYFYMRSLVQEDPWPHTLLQACQCECTILMPETNRTWRDGIDDILSVCSVEPIDTNKIKYPWELDKKCSFAPKGEDFIRLYEFITYNKMWLPTRQMKTFSDVYEFALSL